MSSLSLSSNLIKHEKKERKKEKEHLCTFLQFVAIWSEKECVELRSNPRRVCARRINHSDINFVLAIVVLWTDMTLL